MEREDGNCGAGGQGNVNLPSGTVCWDADILYYRRKGGREKKKLKKTLSVSVFEMGLR